MEVLTFSAYIATNIFEVSIFYEFFCSAFHRRFAKSRDIAAVLVTMYLCTLGINWFAGPMLDLLMIPTVYFVFSLIMFKGKIQTKLLYWGIFLIVMVSLEMIFNLVTGIETFRVEREITCNEINSILFVMITKVIGCIVLRKIGRWAQMKDNSLKLKQYAVFAIMPIGSIMIYFGIYCAGGPPNGGTAQKYLLPFGSFLLFLINVVVFSAYDQLSDMRLTKVLELNAVKNSLQHKHFEELERINTEHRKYIHNIVHYHKVIGSLAANNENEEIISILDEMNINLIGIQKNQYCAHPILNALLSERKMEAERLGVSIQIKLEKGLLIDFIDNFDLIAILGNIIDNGIQAVKERSGDGYLNVYISMENDRRLLMFLVENNYDTKPIRTGNLLVTRKPDKEKHGIGLKNVNEIAAKYKGFAHFDIDEKHSEFRVTVVLKVPEDGV